MQNGSGGGTPRFDIGDQLTITFLGPLHGRKGMVTEVIEPVAGFGYTYRLRFADGTHATLFEFELDWFEPDVFP